MHRLRSRLHVDLNVKYDQPIDNVFLKRNQVMGKYFMISKGKLNKSKIIIELSFSKMFIITF